jgi:hypothetical protein
VRITPFELERWQSVWENRVELNISESGVYPLAAAELLDDPAAREKALSTPLAYPPTQGGEEMRAHIATQYPGATPDNVLATCGCSEANYICTWALVEPGDDVIFLEPNYLQINSVAQSFGANVKAFHLREDLRWAPDLDELRRAVTPKTRLIAVCNPNNPTGAVMSESTINEICAIASKSGAWLLADEVYRGAELNGQTSPTFYGRYERVLCTAGLSKAYGLPGLRTGWIVGPADFIQKAWGYHDYTSIGPAMLTDILATIALEPARRERIFARTRKLLQTNYPVVHDWVASHNSRITHVPPSAGAIALVGLPGTDTAALAKTLLERASVLIVPGEQFALPGYLRVGFGYSGESLRKALARMDSYLVSAATA